MTNGGIVECLGPISQGLGTVLLGLLTVPPMYRIRLKLTKANTFRLISAEKQTSSNGFTAEFAQNRSITNHVAHLPSPVPVVINT